MELTTEDKHRVEQASLLYSGNHNLSSHLFNGFIKGAEYATIYEREQQEKEIERLNRLLVIKENKNDLDWLNALAEVNSELFNEKEALEAERTDLLAKVSLLETLLESEKVIHSNWKKEYERAVAKVSEQEKEIAELKAWKKSEMKLWGPIIDYAQTHQNELGFKLGESISEKILRLLQDRAKP